jgi:hypothetical protein
MSNVSNETIERYLRNELSAGELSDFTFQMVMNPALRKEVEATRILFKTLQTTAAPSSTTSASSSGGYKLIIVTIAGILLAIAAFFFFKNGDSKALDTPPTELILPVDPPAHVPIAAAFESNEFIENAIGLRDVSRGAIVSDFKVDVKDKMLHFSGRFTDESKDAKLTIWNNQKEDFVEERFVFAKKMEVSEGGKTDFKIKNMLSPGVYYFEIRIGNTLEKVGRFDVK